MPTDKRDIIRQLQEDILPLQGFRPPTAGAKIDMGLGPMAGAFPRGVFPTGAIHEFLIAAGEIGPGSFGAGEIGARGNLGAGKNSEWSTVSWMTWTGTGECSLIIPAFHRDAQIIAS